MSPGVEQSGKPGEIQERTQGHVQLVRSAVLVAMTMCVPLGALWSAIVSPRFAVAYGVALLAWGASLSILLRGGPALLAARLACAVLFSLCLTSAVLLGGSQSPAIAYLIIVPVAAGLVAALVDIWVWAAAVSVAILVLDTFGATSFAPAPGVLPGAAFILIPAVFVISSLATLWIRFQSQLERALEANLRETVASAELRHVLLEVADVAAAETTFGSAAQIVAPLVAQSLRLDSVAIWEAGPRSGEAFCVASYPDAGAVRPDPAVASSLAAGESSPSSRDRKRQVLRIGSMAHPIGAIDACGSAAARGSLESTADFLTQVCSYLGHVGERERASSDLIREARTDFLTGLPNRRLFYASLQRMLLESDDKSGKIALIFIDLDDFKRINDSLGHAGGDEVLSVVARRLQQACRMSDRLFRGSDSGLVARLGGDEFSLIVDELGSPADAEIVAERILGALRKPFWARGHEVSVTASIGISLYPDDANEIGALIRGADRAMYAAKRSGAGSFKRHVSGGTTGPDAVQLEGDLRTALRGKEIGFHLQPIFETSTGCITRAEALMRWQHPERGWIPPSEVIPLVERSGLMRELGTHLFDLAYSWLESELDALPHGFRLGLNVSPTQIRDTVFVSHVIQRLGSGDVPVESFDFEVTETALVDESPEMHDHLCALAGIGVRFSLDDFGTGFSSLSLVKRLPISCLKIDRSFIKGLPDNPEDVAIVSATLSMAEALGLSVVAEGVEDEAQHEFLAARGCPEVQGYLFARAMPPEEFLQRFRRTEPSPRDRSREVGTCLPQRVDLRFLGASSRRGGLAGVTRASPRGPALGSPAPPPGQ